MAIYHASCKPLSRRAGRSSVAAAAYRSGSKLIDKRTGENHDYTRKSGVAHSEVIAPHGLAIEREALWNTVEESEKRKDGRTAREWVIALPAELNEAQRLEVARDYVRWLVGRYQVAADLAIHKPSRGGDQRNHHAHILLTTRKMNEDGKLVEKSDIELDGLTLKRRGLPSSKQQIIECRKAWESNANAALARHGYETRIDHRNHEDAGLDALPTTHLGPLASALERRGIKTDLGNINRTRTALEIDVSTASSKLEKLRWDQVLGEELDADEAASAREKRLNYEQRLQALRELRHADEGIMPPNSINAPLSVSIGKFKVARSAFEKLIYWRGISQRIDDWRNAHPVRALLRIFNDELVELKRSQTDLGEVDQDAERKLKLAEVELMRAQDEVERQLKSPSKPILSKNKSDELDRLWKKAQEIDALRIDVQTVSRPKNDDESKMSIKF